MLCKSSYFRNLSHGICDQLSLFAPILLVDMHVCNFMLGAAVDALARKPLVVS